MHSKKEKGNEKILNLNLPKIEELTPPRSKYFIVPLLDLYIFLFASHKLKYSRATKIVIKSLAPHKNIPTKWPFL